MANNNEYKLVHPLTGEEYMRGTYEECCKNKNNPAYPFAHVVKADVSPRGLTLSTWTDGRNSGTFYSH